MQDFGAPTSIRQAAMQQERLQAQEKKVLLVRSLERHAREIVKELEADRESERQSVILGRAFLKLGCMLLINGITRDELL